MRRDPTPDVQRSIQQIKDAQLACFKLRNRSSHDTRERDFTTPRSPSKLDCPFASMAPPKTANSLPTPRSSEAQLDLSKVRSKRSSRLDPLKSISQEADVESNAASDVESGPACPIRFLDQHAPEDVAKYFEEHKHELPRSHEVCVKRFETNSESIKELDAKYGNIVAMIQGLGQKHQPMLPSEPKKDENIVQDEEAKALRRVKKWARAISEGQAPAVDLDELGEERQPHFDRPVKEIRVGESPSRPWGVPIPATYLDRADAIAVESSVPKPVEQQSIARAQKSSMRPKGKCPFDHAAMAAMKNEAPAMPPIDTLPPPILPTLRACSSSRVGSKSSTSRSDVSDDFDTRHFINKGFAFVADPSMLEKRSITNSGTLLLGYSEATVLKYLERKSSP